MEQFDSSEEASSRVLEQQQRNDECLIQPIIIDKKHVSKHGDHKFLPFSVNYIVSGCNQGRLCVINKLSRLH